MSSWCDALCPRELGRLLQCWRWVIWLWDPLSIDWWMRWFIIIRGEESVYKAVFWKRLILRALLLPIFISKKIRFFFCLQNFFQKKFASTSASKFFFSQKFASASASILVLFSKNASASASKFLAPLPLRLPLYFPKNFIASASACASFSASSFPSLSIVLKN